MRILHTSDWHLGRCFHRVDLLAAQAAFIDHLVNTVVAERVDLVCVSGDLYDRALPPVDAVSLCNEALRRLAATPARVVLISGNHDSASRLGFGADLIDAAGVHLRCDPRQVGVPVLVEDGDGPVAVYGLPYLEPDTVRGLFGDSVGRGHSQVVGAAMDRVRVDLKARPGARSVVLAHAFVTGGAGSDSERDISVGGAFAVGADVFDGIDYTALGHLHGPQQITPRLRYSGSPLAYSFSEAGHRKGSWLVELGRQDSSGRADVQVEAVPAPVPRPLSRVSGRLEGLLTDPVYAEVESHFLAVTLTDAGRPAEPMARLQRRFPWTVQLDFAPAVDGAVTPQTYAERVRGRSDIEIAGSFVEHVRGSIADEAERVLFADAFTAVRVGEVGR